MWVYYRSCYQIAMIAMMLGSLSACLVGPDFETPQPPKVNHYTNPPWPCRTVSAPGQGGASQTFVQCKTFSAEWWRLFHSPKMNKLICQGIAKSPNLMAAKATLREGQENLSAGIGNGLFPSVSAQLTAQRGSNIGFFSPSTVASNAVTTSGISQAIFNLFNASVNASYLLDFFGGIRRQIQGLRSQVDYQYFELRAAYLSLTSNIVTAAITVASLRRQMDVTQQLIKEEEKQLAIMKKQFGLGGVSKIEVLAQQTQLAQTRATFPPLKKNWEQARHLLAILVGAFPSQQGVIPRLDLKELHLPTTLPLSIPSALVRQRPDIRAAEALWEAANAQVGVATANLYPQIALSGSWGKSNTVAGRIFSSGGQLWNIGGGLFQPIFRGGALLAERRAAIAAYDAAAATYQEAVLKAFKNVADTLRAIEADARTLRVQKQAELAANAHLNLVKQQFYLGGVSYLSLLDAQRQYQQVRIRLIQAQASRYMDTAALFQALGGGWWTSNCLF
ncbi:RND transporter [Rickettsiella grylli]|uniref:efflux transporter outer membrane subunit n=1 Tax=Rickettsiella grylli TaxID=59196 RepID=UPI0008FD4CC8|nr:efflux transporter outer membrane subunit [Rickettsiella grylli]OIZ99136.1 RND transporter [Rickettsiella grylli]